MLFRAFMLTSFARLAGEGRTKFNSHTRGLLYTAPIDRFAPRPGPYTFVGIKLQCVSGLARRLPLIPFSCASVVRRAIYIHFGCTRYRERPGFFRSRAAGGSDCL